MKVNARYIWTVCLVATMGGLLFGYDWVVVGGAKPFYEEYFNLHTPSQVAWATSCALVGCLIGSVISGMLSDKFGRKRLLILSGLLFTASAIGTAMAGTFSWFVAYRILGGIGIGLASNLSPMYIAELSPAKMRGRFVSINQLAIVLGVVAAQVVNWMIADTVADGATPAEILESWNGQIGWRWMFGAETIPALLFFLLMFFVPESPRWLVKNARDDQAARILAKVGGEEYGRTAVAEIKDTLANEIEQVNFRDLWEPKMVKIIAIGVTLAVFQQWCGINVIFYYAEEIFSQAGFEIDDILFNTMVTGLMMLVFTFVAIFTVDKLGRRFLILVGAASLTLTYALIGGSYYLGSSGTHVLILVLVAVGCYSFSLAPVTWVVLSEIFPNRIRGAAMSISVFALWAACFALSYGFPVLNAELGPAVTFWIFGAVCAVGYLFVYFLLPETKGKTLEEIEIELVD